MQYLKFIIKVKYHVLAILIEAIIATDIFTYSVCSKTEKCFSVRFQTSCSVLSFLCTYFKFAFADCGSKTVF